MASPALAEDKTKALAAAHVVFRVSDGLEPFMVKVVRSLPKSVQVVVLEKVQPNMANKGQ